MDHQQMDRAQIAALGQAAAQNLDIGADDYQRLARRTAASLRDRPQHQRVNAVLGLVGETGEIAKPAALYLDGDDLVKALLHLAGALGAAADHVKKARYHGRLLDYRLVHQYCIAIGQLLTELALANEREMEAGAPDPTLLSIALDDDELDLELGDLAWYLALAADSAGLKLSTVLRRNVDKLLKRWPAGFARADGRANVDG